MGLDKLLDFRKPWNSEIICQFYASYHLDSSTRTIHWTTEGNHYKVDAITFSRLLGFGSDDRKRAKVDGIPPLAISEYQYMYMKGHRADGKTVWLKPYYYVLNNILRQTLYPKGGDATYLHDDSPVVLDCFGEAFTSLSISHYIWNRIFHASEDVVKHFPYAPCIMHIIEQVLGIKFPTDAPHAMLTI